MHILRSLFLPAAVATVFTMAFSSCGSSRQAIYFRDDPSKRDSILLAQPSLPVPEAILQPGDIIAINISSESSIRTDGSVDLVQLFREGGTAFNVAPNVGGQQAGGGQTSARLGYLIDPDGSIDFPIVGRIMVGGTTTRVAKQRVAEKLSGIGLKNPIVEVRILNFKVVVLGEVARPGTVIAPGHTISILDALAAAGDATITANKENVMLIRNDNGTQVQVRLNLASRDILRSPYFYLRQGDVLYIEPTSVRLQQNNEFLRIYLPAISSLLATVVSVYGLIRISQQN